MTKLSDYEFKHSKPAGSNRWKLQIGDYTLVVFGGGSAASAPITDEKLNDYIELEVIIMRDDYIVNIILCEEMGIYYTHKHVNFNHGLNEPVANIIKFIKILQSKNNIDKSVQSVINVLKVQEKPCKFCQRMNDIGVAECWYCCRAPH